MPHPVFTTEELALLKETNYVLSEKDSMQLSTPDDKFKRLSWEDICTIVQENRLEDLKRVPSDLKRYILWCEQVKRDWKGGVMEFILKERLQWGDCGGSDLQRSLVPSKKELFESEDDVKVLVNDWPYGLAPSIVHLVVWTKNAIPIGPDGDLTPESRKTIDEFVNMVFGNVIGNENVVWFKNWRSLQTVPSVEHFHVLVRNASEDAISGWTEGPWGTKGKRKERLFN
ncbi:hypothetical protein BDZ91DRAFT_651793 [Kalaharituber pfeilii]|nr:hypothetical protein BDZ91DRAFT_651793 [Kalaharituber pfeilii]